MPAGTLPRPDYGLDAPGLVRGLFIAASVATAISLVSFLSPWPGPPWGEVAGWMAGTATVYTLGLGCYMVYGSRVGKLKARERLLDYLTLQGNESILDVGCGRGLMLIGAARRLPSGKAVGIDLWQSEDQADNRPEATLENARRESVSDRVEVRTGDMRQLPFPDGSFDAVVSHWAIHNLYKSEDRLTALREIVRVLKPGGTVVLGDIQHHREYARGLKELGMTEVGEIETGWRTMFGSLVSMGNFRPAAVVGRKG